MRRPMSLNVIVFVGVLAGLIAACGGSSSAPSAGATAEQAAGEATPVPNAGGSVEAVTIAEAAYTTGSAHVEVSGGKQATLDGQLVPGASMTVAGTTLLIYAIGEGENASVFSISNGGDTGLGFTLTAPGLVIGGDGTSGCAIELTKNDSSGVEGQFDCQGLSTAGFDQAVVGVRATFTSAH